MSAWERVCDGMRRMWVGTGWLVQDIDTGTGTFVPDPDGVWVLPGTKGDAVRVRTERIRAIAEHRNDDVWRMPDGDFTWIFTNRGDLLLYREGLRAALTCQPERGDVVLAGVVQPGPWTEAEVDEIIAKATAEAERMLAQVRDEVAYRAGGLWAAWKAGGGA